MASSKLFYTLLSWLLPLFFSLSFPTFTFSSEPLNPEVEALIAIRRDLRDPHGVLSNWDEDSVDPCSWAMITCSSLNLVIAFGAPSQSLSGTLSGRISNLTNLQQVLLQNNNITGELPQELGLLQKLQTLDLSNNGFSGPLPESLGRLSNLRYLRLNNNSLSGAFPATLSKIPQLTFLDLSYNNLSGPVPLFPARTFNIVGNPLICGTHSTQECSRTPSPISLPFLLESSKKRSKGRKLAVAMGTSLGVSTLLLLTVSFLLWRRTKKQKHKFVLGINETEYDDDGEVVAAPGNLRQFTLRELLHATDGFNRRNVIGKGGFGNVYKGRLSDGTAVAVKRLKDVGGSSGGEAQFRTELEMISLAVHRNLLRLIGFCAAPGERLLVYPFMPNGSVASRLRGKPPLDWNTRKQIAVGAARGLVYLHEQCDPKIIHRDVKAANVLLDERCEAAVGDFGLAKLLDHGESHVTTAVRGTVGHIAPEYLSTGQSSDKTDVFGFGVLLLELVTGRRAIPPPAEHANKGGCGGGGGGIMLDWVRKAHQEKRVELLVDPDLGPTYDRIEVAEMVQVALLCTQYLPAHRPKMSEVVRMLEGDGLADKWEASNRPPPPPPPPPPTDDPLSAYENTYMIHYDDDGYWNDGDSRSIDEVEEMELSGPR
ncbi:LOW QUALITY PROTEIN: probable LRR receptor-like serine/threonine-protein kinase At2g23950 [Ananas comosus]|uniref:non-specific serine/threonine protein kinase n=1 Tax=Ananas comosus TaxID=4615 RepID=A0A6P5GRT2_ANACO|nr:LOW QUALITY PROTEIN: probable LRR receptor-like serine/threonine-protein kinase At2g23950 [Ananas comosus]